MSTIWREDFLPYAKDSVLILSETLFYFLKNFLFKISRGCKVHFSQIFFFYG